MKGKLIPYYQDESVTLYCGDCLQVMPQLDIKFDACITDPPYGTTACKWDNVIPFEPMWNELKRLVKKNGAICLFGSEPFSSCLRCSNLKLFKYDWIWNKSTATGFLIAKKIPMKQHEIISVFGEGTLNYYPIMIPMEKPERYKCYKKSDNFRIMNNDGEVRIRTHKYPKSIITYSNSNHKNKLHSTQKPVELMQYLIKTYTNENDVVLDFTAGSGSTGIAAIRTNRRCVMIEREEKYCEIIVERIENEYKTMAERIF